MNIKLSKYNIYFEHNEKKFVYNTLSTALIQLDADVFDLLRNNELEKLNLDYVDSMKKMHFLIEKNNDESKEFFYFYDSVRYGKSSKIFSIILIPSYACNLACPYCLQGQEKSTDRLDEKSLNSILLFMDKYLNSHKNIDELRISLYGGEPMLNKDLLYKFCDKSNEIAIKYNCDTYFSMTSNMTLLDEKMIEYMKKYQIHTQVSIDGTPEQHDKKRIYKNGKGTYDLIVKNLKKLNLHGLRDLITIRLNIDSSNIEDAESIMGDFVNYSDDVYFGFLETIKDANDSFNDCVSIESIPFYVTEIFSECYKKYGIENDRLFGKKSPCSINSEGKFFIDNNLDVYKCEKIVKRKDARVGYISTDGEFIPNSVFFNQMTFSPQNDEKCRECILLPMCGGGCPATKYIDYGLKNGDFHLRDCNFSEDIVIQFLKKYIDNGN